MAREIVDGFIRDSYELLAVLRTLSGSIDPIHKSEIARALHSLKSGASFLGWDELEQEAHNLEDVLKESVTGSHDWAGSSGLLENLINSHLDRHREAERSKRPAGRVIRFTELERRILAESRTRGEQFYRLSCRIDSGEPLPFSRAYLLSSRIETGMTLVKSDPPMDDANGDFHYPSFWLTTEAPESEVFRAANIDLVEVVDLIRLDYDDVLSGDAVALAVAGGEAGEDASLIVDRSRYAEAVEIAEELAWRLEKQPGTPESSLSNDLQRSLESLAFRPLEPLLTDVAGAVGRLAERQGVKARFEWNVASGGLDAGTVESLGEILKQLIRNSIRHGIEEAAERKKLGKEEVGVLALTVDRSGRSYHFQFSDDGKGIDENLVYSQARENGMLSEGDDSELLDLLCRPGFSTVHGSDLGGGRGLGLDMVRSVVKREFGSDLTLDNLEGAGLSVSWTLPEKHMRRPYLVFLSEGRTWAIPAGSVHQRGAVDRKKIDAAGQAYRLGGGLVPILGPTGILAPGTVQAYFLEIRHRNRRAVLFVDDLVSEEPWGSDELRAADPVGPWGRALADAKDGVPILSPTLVYAAESTVV